VDTGRVRFLFKDFPIANLHPVAHNAHEAARRAGDLGLDAAAFDVRAGTQPQ
jgi:protein-disulfide isomerase